MCLLRLEVYFQLCNNRVPPLPDQTGDFRQYNNNIDSTNNNNNGPMISELSDNSSMHHSYSQVSNYNNVLGCTKLILR